MSRYQLSVNMNKVLILQYTLLSEGPNVILNRKLLLPFENITSYAHNTHL